MVGGRGGSPLLRESREPCVRARSRLATRTTMSSLGLMIAGRRPPTSPLVSAPNQIPLAVCAAHSWDPANKSCRHVFSTGMRGYDPS